MRRLHPPTLAQWACAHQWKTTTSRPGRSDIVRIRYLTYLRCGLKVKTEELLAVPWNERDFMALVTQTFAKDTIVDVAMPHPYGLFVKDLPRLNAYLVPYGWQLELVREQGRLVGVVRRRIPAEVSGGTITAGRKVKEGE